MHLKDSQRHGLKATISNILDCVLPRTCCLCDAVGPAICDRCTKRITASKRLRCSGCALSYACDCNTPSWAIDRTITLTRYEPPLDRLIAELKFRSKQPLANILGNLLGNELNQVLANERVNAQTLCLVPVPLSPERFRQRGFNQALSIAKAVKKVAPVHLYETLTRTVSKQAQSSLDRAERLVNLRNVYQISCRKTLNIFRVAILVDDVMTTGATVNTCATLLKQTGVQEVWVMVAARTEQAAHR